MNPPDIPNKENEEENPQNDEEIVHEETAHEEVPLSPASMSTMTPLGTSQQLDPDLKDILRFREECLLAHNKYREKHKVGPLELSDKLCTLAQEKTNYMADSGLVEKFQNVYYGVNMFVASGTMYNADYVIKAWYSEIYCYDYAKPGLTHRSNHFTQIVWKDTKYLGVGMKKQNRHTWVICMYDPPGNIVGGFHENVLPLSVPGPTSNVDSISEEYASTKDIPAKQDEFIKGCLDIHNKYRAKHGCPPLTLNRTMNDYSREWAEQLSKLRILRHRPNNIYGENLFAAGNYDPSPEEVVKEWYDEGQFYDYKKPDFSKETGNFTQIVWKETTELGIGMVKEGISTYVVCNYSPHGNILEKFKENVPPPQDSIERMSKSDSSEENCPAIVNGKYPKEASVQHLTFEEQCLQAHNKYRALHGCPPLKLDKRMSAYAQEWSDYLAKSKTLEHRPSNPYGENLFYATFHVTGVDPVQKWYQEIKHYDFTRPDFHPSTGHFTQVVWKKSKNLGVGMTIYDKITFVVCNYEPWGNVLNHFERNVPPLLTKTTLMDNGIKDLEDNIKPFQSIEVRNVTTTKRSQVSPPQPARSSNATNAAFQEQCLQAHNKYRALHGCPPLKIAKYLNDFAMEWAKNLSKAKKFEHRPHNRYGENLYFGSGFRVSGSDPVTTWYNEIHDYDFQKPDFKPNTGHFTQLIWKDSKEVGVAVINLGENTYVVCNYAPAGNVLGSFENNVPMALQGPFSMAELKKRSSTSPMNPDQFAKEILQWHNTFRAKHNSPPLTLNDDLNKLAMEWAKHLADTNTLKHREPPKYGENIFKASGWNITPDELMRMWYNESKAYKYGQNQFVPSAGHFTQLIWKNSKTIGVGLAKQDRSTWIVINYDPPGNYPGEFKTNVLPPK